MWSKLLAALRLNSRVSVLDTKVAKMQSARDAAFVRIADREAAISALELKLLAELKNHRTELANAQKLIEKQNEVISAIREELTTAQKITIPGLIRSNQILLDRWEAESVAIAARSALIKAGARDE